MSKLTKVELEALVREVQRIVDPRPFRVDGASQVAYFVLTPDQFYRLTNGARDLIEAERTARESATRHYLREAK